MVPKFLPLQWIVFSKANGFYLAQIMGARYMTTNAGASGWHYKVVYGDSHMDVAESSVTHYFANGKYTTRDGKFAN